MILNLYLVTQHQFQGYEVYDQAVVCAGDQESAKRMHPQSDLDYDRVEIEIIGVAVGGLAPGVVLSSFLAG